MPALSRAAAPGAATGAEGRASAAAAAGWGRPGSAAARLRVVAACWAPARRRAMRPQTVKWAAAAGASWARVASAGPGSARPRAAAAARLAPALGVRAWAAVAALRRAPAPEILVRTT